MSNELYGFQHNTGLFETAVGFHGCDQLYVICKIKGMAHHRQTHALTILGISNVVILSHNQMNGANLTKRCFCVTNVTCSMGYKY